MDPFDPNVTFLEMIGAVVVFGIALFGFVALGEFFATIL